MMTINLLHMDCIEKMERMIKIEQYVDLIITDPPYKITPRGNAGTMGGTFSNKLANKGEFFKYNDTKIQERSIVNLYFCKPRQSSRIFKYIY